MMANQHVKRCASSKRGNLFPKLPLLLLVHLLIVCIVLFSFLAIAYADNFPIIGVLHAGQNPEALSVDTQTHMLYIAYEFPSVIVGFDPIHGKVNWRTPLGNIATDVEVDSTSHHVYATTSAFRGQQSTLFILDGASGRVLFTTLADAGDNGIALDMKRQQVYVASPDSGTVDVFTFLSGWQSGPIHVMLQRLRIGAHPQGLGVNSQLGRLYVADATEHIVTVLEEESGHILATIPIADGPLHPLRVDETTGRVYIVCSTGRELDVLDGKTNRIIAHVPVAPDPEGSAVHTATGRIYVADEGNDRTIGTTITVIDGQTFNVLGTFSVGRSPDGVEADPELHRVYIAAEDSNAVVEISDSTNLPLIAQPTTSQSIAARQAINALQWATILTLIGMCLTIIGATLYALLPHWRERGILQTRPDDVSSL
jgi:DNA-binding beta-propeller fold protein YncE